MASFLEATSLLFGWIYTISWSLSFYPQPLLCWRRKSTAGATIDFPAINILGFVAYLSSNLAFLYSPQIRKEYAIRNHGLTPTVALNDVYFAAHAVVVCTVIISQFIPGLWGFEKRSKDSVGARISKPVWAIQIGSLLAVGLTAIIVASRPNDDPKTGWAWIDVIYAISFVKLLITLVKYTPQIITNVRNQSTNGWSIHGILFDFVGGILSLGQLFIDSYLQHSWSGITGNPVKFALAIISIGFDVIFFVQHYWLYEGNEGETKDGEARSTPNEQEPLLSA